ncbi:MAG: DUF1501 domain-containing protein, partial [Limisphaerales bacterium]
MPFLNEPVERRCFLNRSAVGIGAVTLHALLNPWQVSSQSSQTGKGRWEGVVQPLHRLPKAKRVIYLCMAGGPSHLETLDYKPKLAEMDGKPMPESITRGQPIAQLQGQNLKCL